MGSNTCLAGVLGALTEAMGTKNTAHAWDTEGV